MTIAPVVGIAVAGVCQQSAAETLRVMGFNVESGGAAPAVVDDLIAVSQDVDLWGLSEVQNAAWADLFERAAEDGENADFAQVLGTTGGGDRLLIIYDADRFELVRHFELDDINI